MNEIVVIAKSDLEQMLRELGLNIAEQIINRMQAKKPATYTRKQAAAELGVSPGTITNMIESGRLKTTADGRFISSDEIQKYLNLNK